MLGEELSLFSGLNKLDKQTGITLFICGGPRHLSSFKQCSEKLIFNILFIHLWKQYI